MIADPLSLNPISFPSSLPAIKSMNSTFISPKTNLPPYYQDLRLTHVYNNTYHRPFTLPANSKSQIPLRCSRITEYIIPKRNPHILLAFASLQKPKSQILHAAAANTPHTNADLPPFKNKTLQLAVIFGLWYFQSVIFNIYTKKVLNVFPFPWLLASFQLLVGSIWMFFLWSLKLHPCPRFSKDFIFALLCPAFFHTIAYICAFISVSKVAVSFTHVIKSSEPVFSVVFSSFLGDTQPLAVWLSILPIVFGCSLAAVTEVSFNLLGFWGALISNVGSVLRIIYSKKSLENFKEVKGLNLNGCIGIVSLSYLFPVAVFLEGSKWVAGYHRAVELVGKPATFYLWVILSGIFYHLYNQSSFQALDDISPLTFSVGNTMKRVVVIVSTILVFRNPVRPLNALGSAIAIFGTFLYSQASAKKSKSKKI